MKERLSSMKVWRVKIGERMNLETVESALGEACIDVMQKVYPEGAYGVIERVDIRDGETTVYISGNERTAKALSRSLRGIVPSAKVTISTVTPTHIRKLG